MQIILMSGRLGRARSISLSARHLFGTAFIALVTLCAATAAVYWLTLRYAADLPIPALHKPFGSWFRRIAGPRGKKSATPSRRSKRSTTTPRVTASIGLRFAPSIDKVCPSRPVPTNRSCA